MKIIVSDAGSPLAFVRYSFWCHWEVSFSSQNEERWNHNSANLKDDTPYCHAMPSRCDGMWYHVLYKESLGLRLSRQLILHVMTSQRLDQQITSSPLLSEDTGDTKQWSIPSTYSLSLLYLSPSSTHSSLFLSLSHLWYHGAKTIWPHSPPSLPRWRSLTYIFNQLG